VRRRPRARAARGEPVRHPGQVRRRGRAVRRARPRARPGGGGAMRAVLQSALADLADVPARSRWVRSGELRLHVLDYGGPGVPLVVLPGITSPAITMDFVARRLTDLVRPIVVDVRGRGLSDAGASYTLEDYADDTEA